MEKGAVLFCSVRRLADVACLLAVPINRLPVLLYMGRIDGILESLVVYVVFAPEAPAANDVRGVDPL